MLTGKIVLLFNSGQHERSHTDAFVELLSPDCGAYKKLETIPCILLFKVKLSVIKPIFVALS